MAVEAGVGPDAGAVPLVAPAPADGRRVAVADVRVVAPVVATRVASVEVRRAVGAAPAAWRRIAAAVLRGVGLAVGAADVDAEAPDGRAVGRPLDPLAVARTVVAGAADHA